MSHDNAGEQGRATGIPNTSEPPADQAVLWQRLADHARSRYKPRAEKAAGLDKVVVDALMAEREIPRKEARCIVHHGEETAAAMLAALVERKKEKLAREAARRERKAAAAAEANAAKQAAKEAAKAAAKAAARAVRVAAKMEVDAQHAAVREKARASRTAREIAQHEAYLDWQNQMRHELRLRRFAAELHALGIWPETPDHVVMLCHRAGPEQNSQARKQERPGV